MYKNLIIYIDIVIYNFGITKKTLLPDGLGDKFKCKNEDHCFYRIKPNLRFSAILWLQIGKTVWNKKMLPIGNETIS